MTSQGRDMIRAKPPPPASSLPSPGTCRRTTDSADESPYCGRRIRPAIPVGRVGRPTDVTDRRTRNLPLRLGGAAEIVRCAQRVNTPPCNRLMIGSNTMDYVRERVGISDQSRLNYEP